MTAPLGDGLELRGISFRYGGDPWVFSDVSWHFPGGVSTAIRGRSGSGKSTLISLLGLLRAPTVGEVFVGGRSTGTMSDRERSRLRGSHIGFVFQDSHLAAHQPVWKSIALPVLLAGNSRRTARRRAFESLERVHLEGYGERRPDQLSGGQRQRCAVARAVATRPHVVIADEPTGSLDEQTADIVATVLYDLARDRGASVIVVTHDAAIAGLADAQLTLSHGSLR